MVIPPHREQVLFMLDFTFVVLLLVIYFVFTRDVTRGTFMFKHYHLPIGHLESSRVVLAGMLQPHFLQNGPFRCSHLLHMLILLSDKVLFTPRTRFA